MKTQDTQAITSMNPAKHIYLSVVNKDGNEFLVKTHKGWLGRLWMKIGFSSASMKNVAKYIVRNKTAFEISGNVDLSTLIQKVEHYSDNHKKSTTLVEALSILRSAKPKNTQTVPLSPQTPTPSEQQEEAPSAPSNPENPTVVEPQITPLQEANNKIINQFIKGFVGSDIAIRAPIKERNYEENRQKLHTEVDRLAAFLDAENKKTTDANLVYICIGHGGVKDPIQEEDSNSNQQVWPKFIFDALTKDQKVQTCLIEFLSKYPINHQFSYRLMSAQFLKQGGTSREEILPYLSNFSVNEFLCGLPGTSEESRTPEEKKIDPLIINNLFWKESQIKTFEDLFPKYVEKLLKEGKTVVIGDHRGCLSGNGDTENLYNNLIEKYPNQLSFLWGWGGFNLLTNQKITENDVDPSKPSKIWTHYDHLSKCSLPETNSAPNSSQN